MRKLLIRILIIVVPIILFTNAALIARDFEYENASVYQQKLVRTLKAVPQIFTMDGLRLSCGGSLEMTTVPFANHPDKYQITLHRISVQLKEASGFPIGNRYKIMKLWFSNGIKAWEFTNPIKVKVEKPSRILVTREARHIFHGSLSMTPFTVIALKDLEKGYEFLIRVSGGLEK